MASATPTAINARTAALTISTNDPIYPTSTVALTGKGITRIAGVSPGLLFFANQPLNTTSPSKTVVLSNTGNAPLAITGLTVGGTHAGEHFQTTSCGASLPAGAACNVNVHFRPTASGPRSATLTAATNDPANPSLIVLLDGNDVSLAPVSEGIGTTMVAATFAKHAPHSAQIDVTYDASHCTAPKSAILYGNIGDYSGYAGRAQSNAGNMGIATIDGTALNNVWFNIVWTDGTTAGHPGFIFDGTSNVPRTWSAAGLCGMTADDQTRATCP